MVFNSLSFFLLFVCFLALYYAVPARFRSGLLLLASYVFYATYKPVYVLIMGCTTVGSFYLAHAIGGQNSVKKKKRMLVVALWLCILILVFFKYYNFFNGIFQQLFSLIKLPYNLPYLDILLPVGISFFIFETIGYLLDVYYELRPPEEKLGKYALFISYFPKLLAGPIERSTTLLPQFYNPPPFNLEKVIWGLKLFLFGVFKKMVVADRLALLVDPVYNAPDNYDTTAILLATYLFAFQMYCDFSGYTDMALGLSKTLGFQLLDNFNFPYVSKNVTEFWRRWHISLSTWLRDYLYTPIMFSKKQWGNWALVYAGFITFILCGLWHGPRWTFVIFGLLQGLVISLEVFTKRVRTTAAKKINPVVYNGLSWFFTFNFIVFCFIFFRSENVPDAIAVLQKLANWHFSVSDFSEYVQEVKVGTVMFTLALLLLFLAIERPVTRHLKNEKLFGALLEGIIYPTMLVCVLLFGYYGKITFIYFHF